MAKRIMRFIVGQDQAFGSLLFGTDPDITISAWVGYCYYVEGRKKIWRYAIDFVFLHLVKQHDHCFASLVREIEDFPVSLQRKTRDKLGLTTRLSCD